MEFNMISKENLLNETVFTKDKFVDELINKSLDLGVITEYEADAIKNKLLESINTKIIDSVQDFAYGFEELSTILLYNYAYLVSAYLYENMTPVEALNCLHNCTSERLVQKATRSFELKFSEVYFKVQEYLKNLYAHLKGVSETNVKMFTGSFNTVLEYLKTIVGFETHLEEAKEFSEYTRIFFPGFQTMAYDTLNKNHIDIFIEYAESLIIECDMMKKINFVTVEKIINSNTVAEKKSRDNRDKKKEGEITEAKAKAKQKIKEINAQRVAKGKRKLNKKEEEYFINEAISKAEFEDDETFMKNVDEDMAFTFCENLVDVFVEFICIILKMEGEEIPEGNAAKRKHIATLGEEEILDIIFSHDEIFNFTEGEKEYVEKYLYQNLN